MVENLILGFSTFANPMVWVALVAGALIGYLIGALPGLGPSLGVALLIPFTYGMEPVVAMVMLVALYSAAEYGGAITAVLINAPGTAAAVATAWDGYPLTRQGKAGVALNISIVTSGIGILISTILLMLTAVPLSEIALRFGPAEYFAMALLGLSLVSGLTDGSALKGAIAMMLGLVIATVGLDGQTGVPRFAFEPEFYDGLPLVPVLLGLYALSEALHMLEEGPSEKVKNTRIDGIFAVPLRTYYELKGQILRSSIIGYVLGVIPGPGPAIASFLAYSLARKTSKTPAMFGKGSLEGVAASETANNAAVSGAMAPLLALGIPGSATAAVMIGALMIQGIQPGPMLFTKNPEIPYSIFASLFIGVPVMVLIGLGGAKIWAHVANIPRPAIAAMVVSICLIGAYASESSMFPVIVMTAAGLAGYVLRKVHIPLAPIILGLVLGEMLESNFRRAVLIAKGGYEIFYTSPLIVGLIALALLSFLIPAYNNHRTRRGNKS